MNIKPLVWSEESTPDKITNYTDCMSITPFGRFLIKWKHSTGYKTFVIKETPWGEWGGVFGSLDEAKRNAEEQWQKNLKKCFDLSNDPPVTHYEYVAPKQKRTCPECNFTVENGHCTNQYCNYRGVGWTLDQRIDAWAQYGVEECSPGGGY